MYDTQLGERRNPGSTSAVEMTARRRMAFSQLYKIVCFAHIIHVHKWQSSHQVAFLVCTKAIPCVVSGHTEKQFMDCHLQ